MGGRREWECDFPVDPEFGSGKESSAPFADEEIQLKDPSKCLQSRPARYRPPLFSWRELSVRSPTAGLESAYSGVSSVCMLLTLHMLEKSENFVFQTNFSSLTKVLSSL